MTSHIPNATNKTSESKAESVQPNAVKPQGDKKVGKFKSFGSFQQYQEPEEDQLIDDNEIGYIPNKAKTEVLDCPICHKDFDNEENYGRHIKKDNYSFCTNCSNLFLNEAELKKHKIKCNKCETCGRENCKGDCLN